MADYALEGPTWSTRDLTWSFADPASPANTVPFSAAIGVDEQQTFVDAFARWTSVSGLSFTRVADSAAADIRVGWADFSGTTILGETNYFIAGNFRPNVEIRLQDPQELALTRDPVLGWMYAADNATLLQVATHEIGHALGLGHDRDVSSIMYPLALPTNRDLDGTDVAGINALYGASVAINDVTLAAHSGTTTDFVFTVTRSGGASPVSVDYQTVDGTAAPTDYIASRGTLTFAPGVTSQTITVQVPGDHSPEPAATFEVVLSNASNGATITAPAGTGTIINDDPAATATTAINTAATHNVYRFFDRNFGTHFFTASAAERNTLITTRRDLVFEGVGLQSRDPAADSLTAPVYRFFDTAHGTHFFTASAAERAGILSTRTDLKDEGIGFYEHTVQTSGDEPVYRFFDGALGTHFYTADAGERATILATRPDLTAEGIGFYAPTS